jgi:hypothetical protein
MLDDVWMTLRHDQPARSSRLPCRPVLALALLAVSLFPTPAAAHPGSAIVVDRSGRIYFVDTGAGIWRIDAHGTLTRVSGPAFHWMTLDAKGRFGNGRLPSGPNWEITRAGANPTLILASDFPIALGRDGNLHYPVPGQGKDLQIVTLMPSGRTSVLATLPATTAGEPLGHINGLAAGPDGSLYYTENNAIRRIAASGRVSTVIAEIALFGCESIPGNGAGAGPLLRGLDIDARGTVYVAASGCGSVLKVTPDRKVTTLVQLQSPWSPTAVALSGSDLYVLEYLHTASENRRDWLPRVRKISPDGKTAIIATVDRR